MNFTQAAEYYTGRALYHQRMAGRWRLVIVALGSVGLWQLWEAGVMIWRLGR